MTIKTGTGNDFVTINESRLGATSIDMGIGNDRLDIENQTSGFATSNFSSTLKVVMGTGNDTMNIGTGDRLLVTGKATFDGGLGFDTFNSFSTTSPFGQTFGSVSTFNIESFV